jgi:GNAT superfamily N-acetyltransferase
LTTLTIRPATAADAALILGFITQLAIYERAEHEVVASEADIVATLFGEGSPTEALICSIDDLPVGFAVFFTSYSTWLGRNGIYLEDLYVSPEYRGYGAGKALLVQCGRLEWSVLDWNEPAIQFYQALGAAPQDEWVRYRLTGQALVDLANTNSPVV